MKVIFLDIDGVMNSHAFYEKRHKQRWMKPKTYYFWLKSKLRWILNGFKYKSQFLKVNSKSRTFSYKYNFLIEHTDRQTWKWLSDFCNENDYKICISSVWKRYFNAEEWNKVFIKLGFNNDIFVGVTGKRQSIRGQEIQEWIDKNDVSGYAIVDDDSDMLESQMHSFFLIDGYYGLSPYILYRIKNHL